MLVPSKIAWRMSPPTKSSSRESDKTLFATPPNALEAIRLWSVAGARNRDDDQEQGTIG